MPTDCWTADSCRLDPECAFVWKCRTVADPEEEEMPPRAKNTNEQPTPAAPVPLPTPAPTEQPPAPTDPATPPEQPTPTAPTAQQAARARGDAMANVKDADRNMVEALLAERRGYVQRDKPDGVKQVDEQLKLRGYRTA